jgi:LPS export ABC transporter protein LptC
MKTLRIQTIAMILACCLVGLFFSTMINKPKKLPTNQTEYQFDDLVLKQFDEHGKVDFLIQAKKMLEIPKNKNQWTLNQMNIHIQDKITSQLIMQAKQATSDHDFKHIVIDKAKIYLHQKAQEDMHLTSNQLLVDTAEKEARSVSEVQWWQGKSHLKAKSMILSWKNHIIKIHFSQAKGIYSSK